MTTSAVGDQEQSIESQLGLPSADALYLVHEIIVSRYGGLQGVRSEELLQSSVGSAVNAKCFTPEMDQVEVAGRLAFSLMQNHPFADGNKRTALAAAEMTLKGAGYQICAKTEAIADAMVDFAANSRDHENITAWLRENIEENLDVSLQDNPVELNNPLTSLAYR